MDNNPATHVDPSGLIPLVLAGPVVVDTTATLVILATPFVLAGAHKAGKFIGETVADASASVIADTAVSTFVSGLPPGMGGAMNDLKYMSSPWNDASMHWGRNILASKKGSVRHTTGIHPSDIPCGEWSPRKVDKRLSDNRRKWGVEPVDPSTKIPDQLLDGETFHPAHRAKPKTPHPVGQRNVGAKEEHSRVAKGSGGRGARRR